jgi:hypothetical protein
VACAGLCCAVLTLCCAGLCCAVLTLCCAGLCCAVPTLCCVVAMQSTDSGCPKVHGCRVGERARLSRRGACSASGRDALQKWVDLGMMAEGAGMSCDRWMN